MMNLKPLLDADAPLLMAGPCAAESREQVLETADALRKEGVQVFRAGVWKPRTRPGGFEGVGVEALDWLAEAKSLYSIKIATEVATPEHVRAALKAGVDILWIGARTSSDPFAVQQIADFLRGHDIPVLVKNPISADLELWQGALERLYNAGVRRLGAIHRGFSTHESRYRNAPHWAVPIELKRRIPSLTMLADPSHMGGARELVGPISRQAMELGFDGLMIESHLRPDAALSDAAQQITPAELKVVLQALRAPRTDRQTDAELSDLRGRIDALDAQLLELLSRRLEVGRVIGQYKRKNKMPVLQAARYDELLRRRVQAGSTLGLEPAFVEWLLRAIHEESIRQQLDDLE